jgi:hypothetical protein
LPIGPSMLVVGFRNHLWATWVSGPTVDDAQLRHVRGSM